MSTILLREQGELDLGVPPMAQGDEVSNSGALRTLHECNGTPLPDGLTATRGLGTYHLHCVVVLITWRRCLPLGLGLRLRRPGLRRCWGLRVPGVPQVLTGRQKRGWCNSVDGLHMSSTCPFRQMVCTGVYTCLPRVLCGGWSAPALTHVSYLSFSADVCKGGTQEYCTELGTAV